jgi:hypothetical protein
MLSQSVEAGALVWQSGFEDGFPGSEWLDYDSGAYSPTGVPRKGQVAAWTIIDRRSGEPVYAGGHAYKGWITGPSTELHRAYPVIHVDIPTPLVNTFVVYLDADFAQMSDEDWIHLGTWGNYDPARHTGEWALHTLGVRKGILGFAHTQPFTGERLGVAEKFPLRKWVRITLYIYYEGATGFVQAWQDGVPVLRATVAALKEYPGTNLRTAHWGMYASGGVSRAVQYNDEIRICTLEVPLSDLVSEPACPRRSEK